MKKLIVIILITIPIILNAKFIKPEKLGLVYSPLTYYLNTNAITTLEKSFIGKCLIVYSESSKGSHSYNSNYSCDDLVKIINEE